MLNYLLCGISGVAVTYSMLVGLFPFRRSPVLLWAYFVGKAVVEAYLWYALANGGAGTLVESFQTIWTSVLGIVSLLVIYATFDGSLVAVGICALFCDVFASMCTTIGLVAANFVIAQPADAGCIRPFGCWTFVAVSMVGVSILCAHADAPAAALASAVDPAQSLGMGSRYRRHDCDDGWHNAATDALCERRQSGAVTPLDAYAMGQVLGATVQLTATVTTLRLPCSDWALIRCVPPRSRRQSAGERADSWP